MTTDELSWWVNTPSHWPRRPHLPMKCYLEVGVATGVIIEGRGLIIFGYSGEVVGDYNSVEEMAEAGWEVD